MAGGKHLISNFYRGGDVAEIEPDLKLGRRLSLDEVKNQGLATTTGRFAAQPEQPDFIFVVPSLRGPALVIGDRTLFIAPSTEFRFAGSGVDRRLTIATPEASLTIAAPDCGFFDPSFGPDEKDMVDFFIWLSVRLPMPPAQAAYSARIVAIDGAAIVSLDDVYDVFARELGFPASFGRNLDALWDCLVADADGPIRVLWRNSEASRAALGGKFEALREMLLRDLPGRRPDIEFVLRQGAP